MPSMIPARPRRLGVRALMLAMLLATGCASPLVSEQEGSDTDQATAAQVKIALIDTLDVAAAALHADVEDGVVTLTGFVETQAERERALAATRDVSNVAQVVDAIQIK